MDEKATGSFYTPDTLINYMVAYARDRIVPLNILEPSAGDGRFVPLLKEFNCPITLIELEKTKTDILHEIFDNECEIIGSDFLNYAIKHDKKYDLIIGNPPYISKKSVPSDQRNASLDLIKHFELEETLFQNIWVSFILGSLKLLSDNGAIFFILPFEFLQVQYAEKLREFLEKNFNTIEITTFEDRIFTTIEQDICLVYLSNEPKGKPYIQYTTFVSDTDKTQTFQSVIMRNKPLKKWSNCILNDNETEKLKQISDTFPKVQSFGEISPGIVTGANSFFIVSKKKISSFKMKPMPKLSIISKCSVIPSLLDFKSEDFSAIVNTGARSYLINLNDIKEETFSTYLNEYIAGGLEKDKPLNERYKCRIRKRWYDVPIIKTGEACFFKRFHRFPRVIINSAGVYTTDIAYNIRFKPDYEAASFVFCFYNSLTLALCEYSCRFYGGGVGELVPNEFKALSVPYSEISQENIQHLDELLRNETELAEIVDYVDSIVLEELLKDDIEFLQEIRTRYIKRRMKLYDRTDNS